MGDEGSGWNPWRELRTREHVTLEWRFLNRTRGLWLPHPDGTATIVLDARLSRRERRCTLAHELVHDERGIAYTATTPAALIQAEERAVQRETVRRLIPPSRLERLVNQMTPDPVTVLDIADEFDVDARTARHACARLAQRPGTETPGRRSSPEVASQAG